MKMIAKISLSTLIGGTLALGSAALFQPAQARPTPDCGPTREWVCELPGCPDCYVTLFEGTVCEKSAYEKQTGRKCSPA